MQPRSRHHCALFFLSESNIAHNVLEQRKQSVRGMLETLIVLLSRFLLSTLFPYSATMQLRTLLTESGRNAE